MFLQELTGGLLNGLLKPRFKGLFAKTPVLAVLLLTAVVTACGGGSGGGAPTPGGSPPPPMTTADCMFAEDNGTQDCGLLTLPQVFDYPTNYNITVGEVLAGKEVNTDKIGVSNFTFTQIINGNISDPKSVPSPVSNNNQLILLASATALNLNISGIANNVFGEFYIDLVQHNNTAVKVRYTISITAVNDPPVFEEVVGSESQFIPTTGTISASYRFANIPFNSTTGYSVGNVSTTDVDDDAITYGIDGGTNVTNLFQINQATGEITLKKVAVNPGNSPIEYTFNITASDSKGGSARIEVTVSVLTDNQAPVFRAGNSPGVQFTNATGTTPASYRFDGIPFNSAVGYPVGNVSAMDPDGDIVSYNISGGTDDTALFRINSTTGEITLKVTADTAVNSGNYAFNVTASDGKGGSAIATISVEVLPNLAPVFGAVSGSGQFTPATDTAPANYTFAGILLSSAMNGLVGNVLAMDPDAADGDTVTYIVSDEYNRDGGSAVSNDLFQINSATGEITLKTTATNSGVYTFNVIASDVEGASTTARISVTVGDPTPPVFTSTPYNFDLDLSAANAQGVVVGNVSAVDVEGTLFDYSLLSSGNLFGLAPAKNADGSRNITLLRAATLSDFAASSITFVVIANHQEGQEGNKLSVADITVNLINDLPLDDDSDGDGVKGFYDAFPHDATMNITGNGEPNDPYNITNIYQLQAIAGVDHTGTALDSSGFTNNRFPYGTDAADQLTKHYMLANDIDASNTTDTTIWAKPAIDSDNFVGYGWTPIAGKSGQSFSGSFSGEGYAIDSLNIRVRQGDNSKHFGLFGINNGNITALGVENIDMVIEAPENTYTKSTTIDNIALGSHTGMLVALNQEDGIISYSYTTGYVNASLDAVGGLVGVNEGEISYSYASTDQVIGAGDTGGLVGANEGGTILSTYVTSTCVRSFPGIVGGNGVAGGLVGSISGEGAIINTAYIRTGGIGRGLNGDDVSLGIVAGERDDDRLGGSNVTFEATYWHGNNNFIGINKERADGKHDDEREGDNTGTTGLQLPQLQGCKLDEMAIEGVVPAPTCTGLFPSSDWGNTTDSNAGTFDITRGWTFTANQEPSLSAVRSSDNRPLLPSAAQQKNQNQVVEASTCPSIGTID